MASSGIKVDDEARETFDKFKKEKTCRAIIFKIAVSESGKDEIKVEQVIPRRNDSPTDFTEIWSQLPEREARYIIWDFYYENKRGIRNDTLFYTSWCPDCTPVKMRMKHSSSESAIKKMIQQELFELRLSDQTDADDFVQELKKAVQNQQSVQ